MRKIRFALMATALLSSAAVFAQKQCDLAISVTPAAGYSTTLNYLDSCLFDIKITNNGSAALATTDTIFIGVASLNSVSSLIPVTAVPSGQSITAPKAFKIKHTIDTLKTADINFNLCYALLKQANVLIGNPSRPAAVTYLDNVNTNDTSCNKITLKKRPASSILEWGSSNETLALYPNPAVGEVKFDLKADKAEAVVVSVKDITGREIARKDYGKLPVGVSTTLSLDVSRLKAGLYLVEWNSGERRAVGKLTIKQ